MISFSLYLSLFDEKYIHTGICANFSFRCCVVDVHCYGTLHDRIAGRHGRRRFLADIANNVALALDLVAISLPRTFFLASLCLSSVARSIVGVAAGAARAALTVHFSKANKPADISAKEGSQEVATRVLVSTCSAAPGGAED